MTNTLARDPAENLAALIQCASVTPADNGALDALGGLLEPMGFSVERAVFSEEGTADIVNLYARFPGDGPHLMFAGHTDVVPVGDEAAWRHPPFAAAIEDGVLYGRGAVDMKGGIACFVAALARIIERDGALPGAVSLLITGDEEGPAINGSIKLLKWAAEKGERWDGCILGEPTNPGQMGDMIKIGRRGSQSGRITVTGTQGHVAYPHLASNPLPVMLAVLDALLDPALDPGTDDFQPSNLEVTSVDTGNRATNVIPADVTADFNIRFNDTWTAETLRAEVERRATAALDQAGSGAAVTVDWKEPPSHVFVTRDDALIATLSASVAAITGRTAELSTSGGTSDARFIKDYCPVVEFGLVGKTMHMVDEQVALADLETLTQVYERFIGDWFAAHAGSA